MNTYFQSVRNIATENPNDEQWRLLSQYSFPSNARKYLDEHGFKSASDETIELIALLNSEFIICGFCFV